MASGIYGEQEMFFAATAAPEDRVNMAPKDSASLKIMNPNRIVWVNLTGAENETGAHLAAFPRMTLKAWAELIDLFPPRLGSRQLIDVELVLKSCGFGVPFYDFVGHRDTLERWEERKGKEGLHQHWTELNQLSIDGKPTKLLGETTQ